jgi:hypothetical protein
LLINTEYKQECTSGWPDLLGKGTTAGSILTARKGTQRSLQSQSLIATGLCVMQHQPLQSNGLKISLATPFYPTILYDRLASAGLRLNIILLL